MPRDTSAPAIPLPATLPAIEKALLYLDAKGWRELGDALVTEATRQDCTRLLRAAEGLRLMDFNAPAECRLEALRGAADAVGRLVGELSAWRAPLAPANALVTAQDFECFAPLLAALAREFRRAAEEALAALDRARKGERE